MAVAPVLEYRHGAFWVWLVWALKRTGPGQAECRLGAVCSSELLADHYVDSLQSLYKGYTMKTEQVPLDHAFGARDGVQAIMLGYAGSL